MYVSFFNSFQLFPIVVPISLQSINRKQIRQIFFLDSSFSMCYASAENNVDLFTVETPLVMEIM